MELQNTMGILGDICAGRSRLTGMVVIQLSTLGGGLSQELLGLFHLVVLVSVHCMLHFERDMAMKWVKT